MKSLKDIVSAGAFISDELVKKTGLWKRYSEETGDMVEDEVSFFVRKASYSEYKRVLRGEGDDITEEVKKNPSFYIEELTIASCIRLGEKGEEKLSLNQALSLESGLLQVFWQACQDICIRPKKSPPSKNSGANSYSTASAVKPSRKRKKI